MQNVNAQKGVVALAIPFLLLLIIGAVVFILISQGIIKNPFPQSLQKSKKEPTVSLQTQYRNPFDKGSQYINPFSAYKNPFDAIKR